MQLIKYLGRSFLVFVFSITLSTVITIAAEHKPDYVFPKPGSSFNSPSTSIIIKYAETKIDRSNFKSDKLLFVIGSLSGNHSGKTILSDDSKTLTFTPNDPFLPGENVTIRINSGISLNNKIQTSAVNYTFNISKSPNIPIPFSIFDELKINNPNSLNSNNSISKSLSDLPPIKIDTINNPSPGNLFITNFTGGVAVYPNNALILTDSGKVLNNIPAINGAFDYKYQSNGTISYASVKQFFQGFGSCVFYIMNENLSIIDSAEIKGGYLTDFHDFILQPNGHKLLMAYDPQIVDMSKIVTGGNPAATVLGAIIQEQDSEGNVVFQWRSWDTMEITDSWVDMKANVIDYVHINAFSFDLDGNIIMSSKNLSEITKINRATGEIMWRFSGKKNQFTVTGDDNNFAPNYVSNQHNVTVMQNGHFTIFDNGNQHNPSFSRAVEFSIDGNTKTAHLEWEYRHNPLLYSPNQGSVQRLPNGNTLIGWGGVSSGLDHRNVTEVHPDKSLAFELTYPDGMSTYRAFKYPWKEFVKSVNVKITDLVTNNSYTFTDGEKITGVTIDFITLEPFDYNNATVVRYSRGPVNPSFDSNASPDILPVSVTAEQNGMVLIDADVIFDLSLFPQIIDKENTKVYFREVLGEGKFTQLISTYNSGNNTLTAKANQFGEFVFGVPAKVSSNLKPLLASPSNGAKVNQNIPVQFSWSPQGIFKSSELQIATDSIFTNLIVDQKNISETFFKTNNLSTNTSFFWRVRNLSDQGTSDWSSIWKFQTSDAFIKVISPDGNEKLKAGNKIFIVWNDNIDEKVKISLLLNHADFKVISDSTNSTGSLTWTVPSNFSSDTTFTVKISSILNASINDESGKFFEINTSSVSVSDKSVNANTFTVFPNYPNPFNPNTSIKVNIVKAGLLSIDLYNINGQKIKSIYNKFALPGIQSIDFNGSDLSSGVYFYRVSSGNRNITSSFVLMK